MPTVQELAREAGRYFATRTRPAEAAMYVTTTDDAPDWMRDIVRRAHGNGNMLPDDWRYVVIRDSLDVFGEGGEDCDLDDLVGEIVDSAVDVYDADRVAWLGSHPSRPGYCDEARRDAGVDSDDGILDLIALGQYAEAREIVGVVLTALRVWSDVLDEEGPWSSGERNTEEGD